MHRPFNGYKAQLLQNIYRDACHSDGTVAVIVPTIKYGAILWSQSKTLECVQNFNLHMLFVLREQFILPEYLDELEIVDAGPKQQFALYLSQALGNSKEFGTWGRKIAQIHMRVLQQWPIINGEFHCAIINRNLNTEQQQWMQNMLSRLWLDWTPLDLIAQKAKLEYCKTIYRTTSIEYWDSEYLCQGAEYKPKFYQDHYNSVPLSSAMLQPVVSTLSQTTPTASMDIDTVPITQLATPLLHPTQMFLTTPNSDKYIHLNRPTPTINATWSPRIEMNAFDFDDDLQLLTCDSDDTIQFKPMQIIAAGQTCLLSHNKVVTIDDIVQPCLIIAIERQYITVVYDLTTFNRINMTFPTFIRPYIVDKIEWTSRINAIFVPGYMSPKAMELYSANQSFLQQPYYFTYDRIAAESQKLLLYPSKSTFIMTGMTVSITTAHCSISNMLDRNSVQFNNCRTYAPFYITTIDKLEDTIKGFEYIDSEDQIPTLKSTQYSISISSIVSLAVRLDLHTQWIPVQFSTWADGECDIQNLAYGTLDLYCNAAESSELIQMCKSKTTLLNVVNQTHRCYITNCKG